ncbi:VOC family protein [Streptomyces sp. NPDC051940]|uniref:VOC family protein n=1 Tax=Streptomyces sp. NPDC051940 TaxID=3155675 RepID=UPI00342EFFD8
MQKIRTFLWFDTQAEEAAEFYTSLFPDSKITDVQRYGEAGPGEAGTVMTVEFELAGTRYIALNGGPEFTFNEAVSLSVDCDGQAEVDRLWAALTADGGEEGPCGWLKDKYGLSWQIVPAEFTELVRDPDPQKSARAMQAMLGMKKLDLEQLRAAHAGREA